MRRRDKQTDREFAWKLLRQAPLLHLAGSGPDGPILRTVHPVVVRDRVAFHGADKGEKTLLSGAVCASVERALAAIPSYWVHPERACPATTLYDSAMVHGQLEKVEDLEAKTEVLQALMARYQSEGGHAPIDPDTRLYRRAVQTLGVWWIVPDRVVGKRSLGQNKPAKLLRRWVEGLWERGDPRDLETAERILELRPDALPDTLAGPHGTRVVLHPPPRHLAAAVALLETQYWQEQTPAAVIRAAHRHSAAWLTAVDAEGAFVGTARALSDRHKLAYVLDVAVHPDWRGRGVGRFLMERLADHPAVRQAQTVALHTRDAMPFYERLGYRIHAPADRHTMVRRLTS